MRMKGSPLSPFSIAEMLVQVLPKRTQPHGLELRLGNISHFELVSVTSLWLVLGISARRLVISLPFSRYLKSAAKKQTMLTISLSQVSPKMFLGLILVYWWFFDQRFYLPFDFTKEKIDETLLDSFILLPLLCFYLTLHPWSFVQRSSSVLISFSTTSFILFSHRGFVRLTLLCAIRMKVMGLNLYMRSFNVFLQRKNRGYLYCNKSFNRILFIETVFKNIELN